jgi:AcrR family transcriptional regulator
MSAVIDTEKARDATSTISRRGEACTQAILGASIELLAEVGFDRMTMDTVAARARASKATIYRHWPDKASLVLDALRHRGSFVHDLTDTGSLRGDLMHYVREAVESMTGIDGSLVIGLLAAAPRDPELAAVLGQQVHHEQLPAITTLVGRASERGEVGPDVDPSIVSEVLPGALIMRILVLGLPGDEEFIRRLVDDILIPLLTRPDAERDGDR